MLMAYGCGDSHLTPTAPKPPSNPRELVVFAGALLPSANGSGDYVPFTIATSIR